MTNEGTQNLLFRTQWYLRNYLLRKSAILLLKEKSIARANAFSINQLIVDLLTKELSCGKKGDEVGQLGKKEVSPTDPTAFALCLPIAIHGKLQERADAESKSMSLVINECVQRSMYSDDYEGVFIRLPHDAFNTLSKSAIKNNIPVEDEILGIINSHLNSSI
jgi:hypothetical protein